MSKEMERLKSKISFNKALINVYDNMNFVTKSNKYDKKIEQYQNELSKIYKRIQELKKKEVINEVYRCYIFIIFIDFINYRGRK